MKAFDLNLITALGLSTVLHLALMVSYEQAMGRSIVLPHTSTHFTVSLSKASLAPMGVLSPADAVQGAPTWEQRGPYAGRPDERVASYVEDGGYVPSYLLDRSPGVVDDLPGDLDLALSDSLGGGAVLLLWVREDGTVASVEEESSDLPLFDLAALRNEFQRVRFQPGTRGGRPTRFVMRIEAKVAPGNDFIQPALPK